MLQTGSGSACRLGPAVRTPTKEVRTMSRKPIAGLAALSCAAILGLAPTAQAASDLDCKLDYKLDGWSLIYKQTEGSGRVSCNNGQSLAVVAADAAAAF